MTQLEMIITALQNLGGTGNYSEIYTEYHKISQSILTEGVKAGIRKTIEIFSSDSMNYQHRGDYFYSVYGVGKGIWGLRSMKNNSVDSV